MNFLNRTLFLGVAISFGLLIASFAVPQKKAYEALRQKLRSQLELESELLVQKSNQAIELKALREDISYLELMARDRLNYYRDGERILRFQNQR